MSLKEKIKGSLEGEDTPYGHFSGKEDEATWGDGMVDKDRATYIGNKIMSPLRKASDFVTGVYFTIKWMRSSDNRFTS